MIKDVFNLIFVDRCEACNRILKAFEKYFCLHCKDRIPAPSQNLLLKFDRKFYFPLAFSYVHWSYNQHGYSQNVIHAIKYGYKPGLAFELGRLIGIKLKNDLSNEKLIPVPQDLNRYKKRGYNQAALLAEGIAEITGCKVVDNLLIRTRTLKSQTTRNRIDRLEALTNSYIIKGEVSIDRIILVDDVVTTGATLQTCAEAFLAKGITQIGIIALATV